MNQERTWMKKCCGLCPFAHTGTLFLHPERAEEFADMASNPYTDFPCHKTADCVEDEDGFSEYKNGANSFTCHGFKTLQSETNYTEKQRAAEGFIADGKGFTDWYEMVDVHTEQWESEKI